MILKGKAKGRKWVITSFGVDWFFSYLALVFIIVDLVALN
jgi:hypothetical protein